VINANKSMSTAINTLQPNTNLQGGRYRILETLGQGGFGITYLAEQVMTKRKVCIKEFFPKGYYSREGDSSGVRISSLEFTDNMERFKTKFIKEAQTIAALDHPNIIHIHDAFEENNTAYYVMEYVEGESLSAIVKRDGALAEDAAVQYIRQVALALEHIHAQQIMHLDVKPGNVMVRSKDNRPILIDFGLSKHYDAKSGEATSTTPVGISHGFAPMEQYKQGGVSTFSPETDIYSLGATLYYLVTGSVPPEAADVADDGLPALPAHLSVSVRTAIVRSMEDKRKNRPHSIKEFMLLLDGGGTAHPDDVVITPIVESEATGISADDERTRFAPTRTYNVGDYYNENGVEGVVFQVWDGGRHGKIVSLDEAQLAWDSRVKSGFFSSSGGSSTGVFNKHDGKANTDKLMARGDSEFFNAAKWCRAKGDGWYLPAVEELKTIYINKSKINPALEKYGTKLKGNLISDAIYWSSTENDKFCAWGVNMGSGYTGGYYKDANVYVRAIYAF